MGAYHLSRTSRRFGNLREVLGTGVIVAGLALATGCAGPRVGAAALSGPGSTPTVMSVAGNSGGSGDSSSNGQVKEAPVSKPGAAAEPGGLPQPTPPASAPSGAEAPPANALPQAVSPATWQVYRNETYKFSVNYPASYVVVPATAQPQPAPAAQVWFQDAVLARSETAALQPPQFAVDVYALPAGQSLDQWLATLPQAGQWERQPVQVGGVQGVRLISPLLMAPNEFVYVAHGGYVYRLTLLGEFGPQMLASFAFVP